MNEFAQLLDLRRQYQAEAANNDIPAMAIAVARWLGHPHSGRNGGNLWQQRCLYGTLNLVVYEKSYRYVPAINDFERITTAVVHLTKSNIPAITYDQLWQGPRVLCWKISNYQVNQEEQLFIPGEWTMHIDLSYPLAKQAEETVINQANTLKIEKLRKELLVGVQNL